MGEKVGELVDLGLKGKGRFVQFMLFDFVIYIYYYGGGGGVVY